MNNEERARALDLRIGGRCPMHGVEWRPPWPRPQGEADFEYVGHVVLH
jgi:hypothetical protein